MHQSNSDPHSVEKTPVAAGPEICFLLAVYRSFQKTFRLANSGGSFIDYQGCGFVPDI